LAELTQQQLEEWILTQVTGTFHYTKAMDGQVKPSQYPKLRVMMHRLKDKGIAYPVNGRDGWWRPADKKLEEICWWESDGVIGENLLLPLGLNKFCYIPKPSLVLVSGKYNAGKTAFCINLVNLNLELWENKIDFYVSEGLELMGRKFKALNSFIPKPPPFKTYRRTENFADVIVPNHLSVVDYLRVDMDRPFAATNKLFEIYNTLGESGIAVVAMQKPPGDRKLAFGGASTAFEPSLYIAMDTGWLGFEKIKIPKILDYDPYSLRVEFNIDKGVNFTDVHEVVE